MADVRLRDVLHGFGRPKPVERTLENLEAERDRLVLWSPVALALGIGIYFVLESEPPLWLGATLLAAALMPLVSAGGRSWGFPIVAALALAALGFAAAQFRTHSLDTAMLERETRPIFIAGEISWIEPKDKGFRLLLERARAEQPPDGPWPDRVRLTVPRKLGEGLRPGQHIRIRAVLRPPPEPSMPGAFDFARRAYFEGLGAVGYAFSGLSILEPPEAAANGGSWSAAWALFWSDLRFRIAARVRERLPGDAGGLAAALITGDRGGISEPALAAMRDAGLAHLLAISGLHMGLVAGLIFGFVRGALALLPKVALYHPIKKWAALVAILGAFGFLFLAGASVPTQRAFIMVLVVLIAVLLDRRGLSLRLVAWAALAILLVRPESLLSASFQMSFAAVVALVAGYEGLSRRLLVRTAGQGPGRRLLWYILGVALTSVIAILATGPLAAYHFNRIAAFGLAANLLAVPLTAFWIMPWAIVAVCLMPLGLEGLALVPMSWGTGFVLAIAHEVASWPGAQLQMAALPLSFPVVLALAGLWLCLWRRPWRLLALFGIAAAPFLALTQGPPDILVTGDGKLTAIRSMDGLLYLSDRRAKRFEAELWQRQTAAASVASWETAITRPGVGLACDDLGCIYRSDGLVVALVQESMALAEDCAKADLVISRVPLLRQRCDGPALVVDRFDLWRRGAHAFWLSDGQIKAENSRDERGRRPWVRWRD